MLGLVLDLVAVAFNRSSHAISCVVRVELCKDYFVCVECVECGFSFDFGLKIEKNNVTNK